MPQNWSPGGGFSFFIIFSIIANVTIFSQVKLGHPTPRQHASWSTQFSSSCLLSSRSSVRMLDTWFIYYMKEYQIHIDCILIIIFKLISEYTSGMIIHYSSRIERRRDLGGLCSHNTLCSAVQVVSISNIIMIK